MTQQRGMGQQEIGLGKPQWYGSNSPVQRRNRNGSFGQHQLFIFIDRTDTERQASHIEAVNQKGKLAA